MTHLMGVLPMQATFGRDGAMFESLLDFVAQLSVGLWGVVILTVVVRFVGIWMYRRGAARRARAAAAAAAQAAAPAAAAEPAPAPAAAEPAPAPAAAEPAPAVTEKESAQVQAAAAAVEPAPVPNAGAADAGDATGVALQPAQALPGAASAKAQRRVFRHWRADNRSTAHVPALAANSTET